MHHASSCPNGVASMQNHNTISSAGSDLVHDGELENISKNGHGSQEGLKQTIKSCVSSSKVALNPCNNKSPFTPTAGLNRSAREKLGTAPQIPAPVPVSPFTSSSSSESSSAGTFLSSPSKMSFSAAVQVSTLQASFAEKTSCEMQEIIGWYEMTASEERFTKIDQRESLPNNAMVYDLDDDEDDDEDVGCDDDVADGVSTQVDEVDSPPSSGSDAVTSLLPRIPKRKDSSLSKNTRSSQIRQHMEACDHLIRNTQYMAEVIAELENNSSCTSSNEHVVKLPATTSDPVEDSSEGISRSAGRDDHNSDVILQKMYQETVELTKTYLSRQKVQRMQSKVQDKPRDLSFLTYLVIPIVLAILMGVVWRIMQGSH
ncbi:hypothetical protein IV203_031607 [Nitzschia inconspicua]|uniref:Uncharacterized protein n=1 Tax=Nitzschia inconspicua TaxID=303405 RepID=A0A9K3P7P4_9STRA|nr:hypothetical protein IV203_011172 [Nitzschia inconspicua]KAG7368864.1 hypothetical protein IV203_031607 [Nitzschia inconspicua]